MKHNIITSLTLMAAAPAALAWPFAPQNMSTTGGLEPSAQIYGQFLQLDGDATPEYYEGGMGYLQLTVNGAGVVSSTAVALPLPTPIAGDSYNYHYLGRGDAGDLDGDGDIDIVYSCQTSFSGTHFSEDHDTHMRIVVCRNDGNGGFTNVWQTKDGAATSLGAGDMKLVDMDRDGDLDLVDSHGGVRIRWNPGNGLFNGTTSIRATPVTYTPRIAVSDFDGNGWPDVAVIVNTNGYKGGRVELYTQDAGTFSSSVVHALPADHSCHESLLADVDGDGRMDLLVSSYDGNLSTAALRWHRNTGSGFAAPVSLWSSSIPAPLNTFQAGDVDEDGTPDLLYAVYGNELLWRRGLGSGSFAPEATLISIPIFGTPGVSTYSQIALGDMDADGKPDLFFNEEFHRNTTPSYTKSATVTQWSGTALSGTVDLTTGDLNNDGRPDLIASDGGSNLIRWYTTGSSGLTAQVSLSTGSSFSPVSVAAADWNGDGWTDLAWSGAGVLRQAQSTFGTGIGWTVSTAATMSGIGNILPADMDGDLDTDILSCASSGIVRIHANDGSGVTWSSQNVATGVTGVSRIAAGQMIPAGRPEVAALTVAGANPSKVITYRHTGTWSEMDTRYGFSTSASYALLMADMNTAQPGLETLFSYGSNTLFQDHDGNPAFNASHLYNLTEPAVQIAAVDWDKNGYTDMLVATTRGIMLYSYQGSIITPVPFFQGSNAVTFQDLQLLDINNDGFTDAVAADTAGELHLITNTSAQVKVTNSGRGLTGLVAGGAADAVSVTASSGTSLRFASPIAPATAYGRFRRSVFNGTTDTPGTALSAAEVSALVENIYLEYGSRRSTPVVPAVAVDGTFNMVLDTASRQTLSGAAGYNLRVRLKSTAASAPVQRFYVELSPASQWVSLDASGNSSPGRLRTSGDTDIASGLFYVRPVGLLDSWRLANFGTLDVTTLSNNNADPDGDGVPNILEYVSSQNPNSATSIGTGPVLTVTNQGTSGALLANLPLLDGYDSRVRLTIERSTSLNDWSTFTTRTGTGGWSASPASTTTLSGGRTRYVFNTGALPILTPKFFLRLKAEELP